MTKIFSIFDTKAENYADPMFFQSTAAAIRAFSDGVNDPATMLHRHREDFIMFELGEFDTSSGQIVLLAAPVSIVKGIDIPKTDA